MTDHLSSPFPFFREEVLRNALARLDTSHQQEEEEKEREVAIALGHLARSLIYFMVCTATLFELLLLLIRQILKYLAFTSHSLYRLAGSWKLPVQTKDLLHCRTYTLLLPPAIPPPRNIQQPMHTQSQLMILGLFLTTCSYPFPLILQWVHFNCLIS
jgi:hypothetical protein